MKIPGIVTLCAVLLSVFPGCSTRSVFVSGNFYSYDGYKAPGLMTIWNQGGKQTFFDPGAGVAPGNVFTMELGPDNDRYYLAGEFSSYEGVPAGRIVAVDKNGKNLAGTAFKEGAGFNGPVHVIARDPSTADGYFVGGEFTEYNGAPAPGIIRLKGDGTIDTSFDPGSGIAYALSANPARIIAVAFDVANSRTCFGGSFTSYRNVATNNFICIDAKGGVLTDFNSGGSGFTRVPNAGSYEGEVDVIVIDEPSGAIYVSGRFNRYNDTQITNSLVRLNSNGSFDRNYELEGQATLRSLFLLTAPNAIITGGKSYRGTSYNSLIKIDRDTGDLLAEFAVTPGSVSTAQGLAPNALVDGESVNPGKLFYAGGATVLSPASGNSVTHYNLQEQPPLLRIDKTTGAIDQNFFFADDLAVKGGASPASISLLRAFRR